VSKTVEQHINNARHDMEKVVCPEIKKRGLKEVISPVFDDEKEAVMVALVCKNYIEALGFQTKPARYSKANGGVKFGFVAYSEKHLKRAATIKHWQRKLTVFLQWFCVGLVVWFLFR